MGEGGKISDRYRLRPASLTGGGRFSVQRAPIPVARSSFLGLEVAIVGFNEGLTVLSHREKSQPLLFVQGHGKSAHPVDGKSALLADLHSEPGVPSSLEPLVFGS